MTRTLRFSLLLVSFIKSLWFSCEISFSVFSPVQPSLAVTQKPSSLPVSGQTLCQGSAASETSKHSLTSHPKPPLGSKQEEGSSQTTSANPVPQCGDAQKQTIKGLEVATNEEGELVQSSVVPWPLPPSTNTSNVHSDTDTNICKTNNDTKVAKVATDSHNEDTSHSSEKSDSPQPNHNLQAQTQTPDLNQLTKDLQLQEEERLLLAKIHLMTGDSSPVSGPRSMKRLIPDPCEIDSTELVDHSQRSIIPCFDTLQEISLSETEELLDKELEQNQEGEDFV